MARKIIILYAKSGFIGHKIIAENYALLLKENGFEVKTHDVLGAEEDKVLNTGKNLYFSMLRRAPWLWRWLYYNWPKLPAFNWVRLYLLPLFFKKTQELLLTEQADLVITTHPIATSIANYLKAKGKVSGKLFTTFSDWHMQRFWVFPQVDKYLVVTTQHKQDLLDMGFKKEQIIITGMLLGNDYYNAPNKEKARSHLRLPMNRKTILVMGGGRGWQIEKLIHALVNLRTPVKVIVIGATRERQRDIEQFIQKNYSQSDRFEVLGFTELSLYFAASDLLISKPGGLTVSQAFLLKVPLLAVHPLPGQEDENSNVLARNKAIISVHKTLALSDRIDQLFINSIEMNRVAEIGYQLAPINAQQKILSIIESELH